MVQLRPSGNVGGGGLDTFVAVYHDLDNPTECICPTEATAADLLLGGHGGDENCDQEINGGGGFVTGEALIGDCFMVRVAGFPGQGNETGPGSVVFTCDGERQDLPTPFRSYGT